MPARLVNDPNDPRVYRTGPYYVYDPDPVGTSSGKTLTQTRLESRLGESEAANRLALSRAGLNIDSSIGQSVTQQAVSEANLNALYAKINSFPLQQTMRNFETGDGEAKSPLPWIVAAGFGGLALLLLLVKR